MLSRRCVVGWLGATSAAGLMHSRSAVGSVAAPPLGLNTWSLRELKHDQAIPAVLRVMQENGLHNCQLSFSHAEPEEFDPDIASMMKAGAAPLTAEHRAELQRKAEARRAWRLSVPLSYFMDLRAQFHDRGLTIQAYGGPIGGVPEEIDRLFLMAKTLGAGVLITRLPEAQTDIAAAAAARHGLLVGIQFSDPQVLKHQLRTSPRLRADPDTGDLTKAGMSALEFVREYSDSICCLDLKDAIRGGASVPFGTGDAQLQPVLEYLVRTHSRTELYIDCDYPGTGTSTEEVKRCVEYVRSVTG